METLFDGTYPTEIKMKDNDQKLFFCQINHKIFLTTFDTKDTSKLIRKLKFKTDDIEKSSTPTSLNPIFETPFSYFRYTS